MTSLSDFAAIVTLVLLVVAPLAIDAYLQLRDHKATQ